jgi:hypothetical protein
MGFEKEVRREDTKNQGYVLIIPFLASLSKHIWGEECTCTFKEKQGVEETRTEEARI